MKSAFILCKRSIKWVLDNLQNILYLYTVSIQFKFHSDSKTPNPDQIPFKSHPIFFADFAKSFPFDFTSHWGEVGHCGRLIHCCTLPLKHTLIVPYFPEESPCWCQPNILLQKSLESQIWMKIEDFLKLPWGHVPRDRGTPLLKVSPKVTDWLFFFGSPWGQQARMKSGLPSAKTLEFFGFWPKNIGWRILA